MTLLPIHTRTIVISVSQPSTIDLLSKHFAYQQLPDGASVYGLIIKNKYYQWLDSTSHHLTSDFQDKPFKHLICSPMDCVRYEIQVEHFVKNIIEFQKSTHPKVSIITYKEKSTRILKNRFTHKEFIKKIKKNISGGRSKSVFKRAPDASTVAEILHTAHHKPVSDFFYPALLSKWPLFKM